MIGVNEILEDGLMDSRLWNWILDTGYWTVAKDLLRPVEKGREAELGDASGAQYWCQQKKSRYAAFVLRNSLSVAQSRCV